ncbi:zf-HC2 domain-containing protein [bacterium]|nr:zf-HC2 domain-containing protein [bacterium]
MSPCKNFSRDLQDYIDNEISRSQRLEIEKHLHQCADCSEHIEELNMLRHQLKSLPTIKATESFHLLLRERIRREMAAQQKRTAFSYVLSHRIVPVAAVCLVLVTGSLYIFKDQIGFFQQAGPEQVTISRNSDAPSLMLPPQSGSIRYVIDEYNDTVKLDRTDTPRRPGRTIIDSIQHRPGLVRSSRHAAQVSF